jgi:hypothetical protein
LADHGIASAVIGGLAVAIWGEPRLTGDADLKVLLGRDDRRQLLDILADDYVSAIDEPEEALRRLGLLFVLSPDQTRIDLMLADTEFDVVAIGRAVPQRVADTVSLMVATYRQLAATSR